MKTYIPLMSFFWNCVKPHRNYFLLLTIAPVVTAFVPLFSNYVVKEIVDVFTSENPHNYEALGFASALFFGSLLAIHAAYRIGQFGEWNSVPYIKRAILVNTCAHLYNHSYTYFQNHFSGALSAKIKGLVDGFDTLWREMNYGLFARFLTVVVGIVGLFVANTTIGIIVVFWSIVMMCILYTLSKKHVGPTSGAWTRSTHKAIGLISDTILNSTALFSFASKKREAARIHTFLSEDTNPKEVAATKGHFRVHLAAGILDTLLWMTVLFTTLYLMYAEMLSIGEFVFIFGLLHKVGDDVWSFSVELPSFIATMSNTMSAFEVLLQAHELPDAKDAKTLQVSAGAIRLNQVHFAYTEERPVLQNFNLQIAAGEKIGLVGHSGAGKSTLVKLLLRYFALSGGTIDIDGQNTAAVTQDSLRAQIGVIPQEPMLFHRTLLENIRYGKPDASEAEVIDVSQKAHIHDFIAELPEGYQTEVGERGIKLSGGQRQRIAIARAMLKDAPILILDEATSSLDSQTEQKVQESLQHLITKSNTTVIAIAHRLSTLRQMDRILVLDKGQIVQEGTHEALLQEGGLYKELWEAQVMV